MSDEIRALQAKADAAEVAFRAAQDDVRRAILATSEFQVGDVIQSRTGDLAQVTGLRVAWGQVELVAVAQKKDGTFGLREISKWKLEWRNPTLHSRPASP